MKRNLVASMVAALFIGTTGVASAVPEDTREWDCRVMGNHVCGPNTMRALPGCYVDGKLEEPWDYYDHYGRTDRPC